MSNFKFIVCVILIVLFWSIMIFYTEHSRTQYCEVQKGTLYKNDSGYVCVIGWCLALKYNDLQPWVEMLCDALENRGASSSGAQDLKVYPYAQQYRGVLDRVRKNSITRKELDTFLNNSYNEIVAVTIQPDRVKKLLEALRVFFYKEFN